MKTIHESEIINKLIKGMFKTSVEKLTKEELVDIIVELKEVLEHQVSKTNNMLNEFGEEDMETLIFKNTIKHNEMIINFLKLKAKVEDDE